MRLAPFRCINPPKKGGCLSESVKSSFKSHPIKYFQILKMFEGECTWEFLCCRLISEGLWPKSWPRQFLLNESVIKTVMKQIWLRRSLLSQLPPPTDSHTFPHLPASLFSSWKMQDVLLGQFLPKLLMANSWLNSKVALPMWALLIYELLLPLGTVLPSFMCRHRQIAPFTLQARAFL